MSSYLGANSFDKFYIGSTEVDKVYLGSNEIYSANTPVSDDCLCFTANTAGSTIAMSVTGTPTLSPNFQTSTDKTNWSTFTPGTTTITLANAGDKVYFKGNNPNGVNAALYSYYSFVMTGSIAASGNVMSLIDKGACTTLVIPNDYCFFKLFYGCSALTTPPTLPATTLKISCYQWMFNRCYSMTSSPALPATTLTEGCYWGMLTNSGITSAPTLPAMNLAKNCYKLMFEGCWRLTAAPELPATTLAESCYQGMFDEGVDASGGALRVTLTEPPELPATTLAVNCYRCMFQDCTSLVKVPTLPATELNTGCYALMFDGCTSLQVSDTQTADATYAWTIPETGTFTNTTQYDQSHMFRNCLGTRSSNAMSGAYGESHTYYTQNQPV